MTSTVPETQLVMHPLTPRIARVQEVRRLSPRMTRVTLTGEDLEGFIHRAPDDHVKLVFPEPGQTRPRMPEIGERGMRFDPEQPRPTYRDYTPRRYDAQARELDVDFVRHGHGPAATWAERAKPGDEIGVLGPRGSYVVPLSFDWYLIAGDETALPAALNWLEALPAGTRATAYLEVADVTEEQPIHSTADVDVRWMHRGEAEPGTSTVLYDAITAFTPPEGLGYAWVAGEAGTLRPIRRCLRDDLGLTKHQRKVDGYWKRGVVNHDHHGDEEE